MDKPLALKDVILTKHGLFRTPLSSCACHFRSSKYRPSVFCSLSLSPSLSQSHCLHIWTHCPGRNVSRVVRVCFQDTSLRIIKGLTVAAGWIFNVLDLRVFAEAQSKYFWGSLQWDWQTHTHLNSHVHWNTAVHTQYYTNIQKERESCNIWIASSPTSSHPSKCESRLFCNIECKRLYFWGSIWYL